MIAPRGRLLVAFAAIAWPALAAITVVPTFAPVAALCAFLFAVVVLCDAFLSRPALDEVGVDADELVRFAKDRAGELRLRVANRGLRELRVRIAPGFPQEFACSEQESASRLPAQRTAAVSFQCTPRQRGRYFLERVLIETGSPLGCWKRRRALSVRVEFRVYPDLLRERKNLAAIFLHRAQPGARAIRRVGKGRDFEQLRDYIAGDSAEDIHWKASAKRGYPVTKLFQVEQTQEVYVVIDSSRLTARVSGGVATLEHFINCALVLCLAAGERNDLFGLTTFADKVQRFVRARNGKAHYNLCRDALYRLQPSSVTPDFDELFTFLRLRLRRRALLVFLTALDDAAVAEAFTSRIDLLARQHVVLVHGLRPPHAQPLFTAPVDRFGEIYSQLGGHIVSTQLRELGNTLHRHGVRLSLVDHSALTADVVSEYLRVKQRQLI